MQKYAKIGMNVNEITVFLYIDITNQRKDKSLIENKTGYSKLEFVEMTKKAVYKHLASLGEPYDLKGVISYLRLTTLPTDVDDEKIKEFIMNHSCEPGLRGKADCE